VSPKKKYLLISYHNVRLLYRGSEKMEKSYYAIIPANVRYDKDLPPNAKLLYGEITALCNEKGYCWAGNTYFSELYSKDKSTIARWLKQLEFKGYITREVIYKEGSREIENRYMRICSGGIGKNATTPIGKNERDNTTLINNTNNNAYSNEFEQFWLIYPRQVDKKKAYKSFKTVSKAYPLQKILEGTEKYAKQVQKTEAKFIKHPATFLNNESFVDGYEEQQEQPKPLQREEQESVLSGMWGDGY
jgi:hypothetical protein